MVSHRENESAPYNFSGDMVNVHKNFRSRVDSLSPVYMCHVCKEFYPSIQVVILHEGSICKICECEKGAHHFSHFNNMDPSEQPKVLRVLTQVEEILIARVNPILQVMHACGGEYKYTGYTIGFPQDISSITKKLPQHVEELYSLIVRRRVLNMNCMNATQRDNV